jgi:hypothetical protein
LKQVGLATQNYYSAKKGLPPSRVAKNDYPNWSYQLLPYLEEASLFAAYDPNAVYTTLPLSVRLTPVPAYICPTRGFRQPTYPASYQSRAGSVGDYAGNMGDSGSTANPSVGIFMHDCWPPDYPTNKAPPPNGTIVATHSVTFANGTTIKGACDNPPAGVRVAHWKSPIKFNSIVDGLSKTLLFGERYIPQSGLGLQGVDAFENYDFPIWSGGGTNMTARSGGPTLALAASPDEPIPPPGYSLIFGGPHPGVCLFVLTDGSVRPISVTINPLELGYLCNRNDGYTVNFGGF